MISELFIRLYGRFEQLGYQIPNRAIYEKEIRLDANVGRLFSEFLKRRYPHQADNHSTYSQVFPDGSEIPARQYPNELLPTFTELVDSVWIPEHAQRYFEERDLKALDYLPILLPPGNS